MSCILNVRLKQVLYLVETKREAQQAPRAGASTREAILTAAAGILAREGYGGLTARNVAAEAGTNIALINYYFGSKARMLLEIFEHLDKEKLSRQRRMYAEPDSPLSGKWRQAVTFYRQDLADGYVRVMQELYTQGYADPAVAERVRARMNGWRSLLREVAVRYLPELGIGTPPDQVASVVVSFWLGMEVQHLAGSGEDDGAFFAILDSIGDWLEAREQEAATRTQH